jgi:hypothetical protein
MIIVGIDHRHRTDQERIGKDLLFFDEIFFLSNFLLCLFSCVKNGDRHSSLRSAIISSSDSRQGISKVRSDLTLFSCIRSLTLVSIPKLGRRTFKSSSRVNGGARDYLCSRAIRLREVRDFLLSSWVFGSNDFF